MTLDKKDKLILDELIKDSSLTTSQISKKIRVPITTVHNRIKKLRKDGIIKGYTVQLDHKKLGRLINSYVLVNVNYTLPDGTKISQETVASKIKALDEVYEVHIVAGGTDLLIKVRTEDVEKLNECIINKLRSIDGVDKTQTMVVLKEV